MGEDVSTRAPRLRSQRHRSPGPRQRGSTSTRGPHTAPGAPPPDDGRQPVRAPLTTPAAGLVVAVLPLAAVDATSSPAAHAAFAGAVAVTFLAALAGLPALRRSRAATLLALLPALAAAAAWALAVGARDSLALTGSALQWVLVALLAAAAAGSAALNLTARPGEDTDVAPAGPGASPTTSLFDHPTLATPPAPQGR